VFFYPENFYGDGFWEDSFFPKHIIGVNYKYQFTEKNSLIRLDYTFVLPLPLFFNFGLSGSYNINKQEFGFAFKTGLKILLFFDIDYRYNITNYRYNITSKNSHEIVVSFSVPLHLFIILFHELFLE
jgi:outer membrane protease